MNKQPTTIRTYLLRSAFLLSLAFVIVMPLALAQTRSANGPRDLISSSAARSHGNAAVQQPASPLIKALPTHPLSPDDPIIYDNGGPNQQGGNEMTQWIQAEDFNLSADSTLTVVNFWDIEAPGGAAYQGEIDWTLYADAGGMPGAAFASGAAVGGDVTRTFIQGGVLGFYDEYSNSFNISPGVALTAGTTYWLGLHNGPLTFTTRSEFYWETTNFNGTFTGHEDQAPFDGVWFDNATEHAFNLEGTTCTPVAFTNPAPISIPDSGPATPYPSDIVVAGQGTVTKVTVTINGLTHTFPDDLDFLLVGPAGQNAIIWSDAGGSDDVAGIVVTLDDDAATPLPDVGPLVSGTYQPFDYEPGSDSWPAPAPVPSGNVALSTFIGTDPNGTWSLYLVDDAALDLGTISGGWTLAITSDCATPTPTPTPTPGQIVLKLNSHRVQGRLVVHLKWTGANTPRINIFRNGVRIARVQNTNTYTDTLTVQGDYTYQVCEAGTGNCSNEKRVRFGP